MSEDGFADIMFAIGSAAVLVIGAVAFGLFTLHPGAGALFVVVVALVVIGFRAWWRGEKEKEDRRKRPHLYPDEMAKIESVQQRQAAAWAAVEYVSFACPRCDVASVPVEEVAPAVLAIRHCGRTWHVDRLRGERREQSEPTPDEMADVRRTQRRQAAAWAAVHGKRFACPQCSASPVRVEEVAPTVLVIRHCSRTWRVDRLPEMTS